MVRLAFILVVLAAGCFEDRYRCTEDAQCDLGVNGRCEVGGYCTSHDPACLTLRSYEAHGGELATTCYDDRQVPLNACAGGQPPAASTGCFANVCARLPACCDLAWTDACVEVAQQECEVRCDTRLAITASRGTTTELWDARWTGTTWVIQRETTLAPPFAWVAPAPGSIEPRLAGTTPTTLRIGDTALEVGAGHVYQSITSVGFDRDNRDTIAAGYDTAGGSLVEMWKLDDLTVREMPLSGNVGTTALAWGDQNRDGFPDAVSKSMGPTYSFLENLETADFVRKVSNQVASNTSGGGTPGAPQVRNFDWLDFNNDGLLDLAVFGASVRLHTNVDGLRDAAERDLDCIPPSTQKLCADVPEPDLESASFGGAGLPSATDPSLVLAAFPARKLYRVQAESGALAATPLPFPGDSCTCQATCTMCPGASCSCTYDCTACVPVLAVVARDLDGDHRLDLIAIDAKLRLYTALAPSFTWSSPTAIPTTFTSNTFFSADVSVSGAPR